MHRFVGTQCLRIDGDGNHVEQGRHGKYPVSTEAIRWEALFRSPMLHPSTMYRREPVLAVGGYRPDFDVAEDFDLWTRLLPRGRLANLSESLMRYRVHDGNVCRLNIDKQNRQACSIAGAYAETLGAGLEARTVSGLYYFLTKGEKSTDCWMEEAVCAFHTARQFFLERSRGKDTDLNEWIAIRQDDLRWRCTSLAQPKLGGVRGRSSPGYARRASIPPRQA